MLRFNASLTVAEDSSESTVPVAGPDSKVSISFRRASVDVGPSTAISVTIGAARYRVSWLVIAVPPFEGWDGEKSHQRAAVEPRGVEAGRDLGQRRRARAGMRIREW